MATARVELAVVGGGLNGMTLGIACASAGLQVAVLDREDPATVLSERFDGRTSAIAFGSMRVLAGIGVWPLVANQAAAILEIRVTDNSAPLFLHYDHREIGDEPLGWIVENRHLRRALYDRAGQLPNLKLIAPMAVEHADYEGVATLTLADGGELRAELIAAADGKNSPLREAARIRTVKWCYPQIGIVTTVRHAKPHHGVAVEHFLPAGPFAILPMTDNRSSIVWTEDAVLAPALLALDDRAFHRELEHRFGDFLGVVSLEGPRWSYPLSFLHATSYIAPRLVLLGEAAHVIHPIAGQGLNMGIRDTAALAECLVDGRRLGLDLSDATLLARYQRWRRFDNVLLAGVTDSLNRLFSNTVPPIKVARDLGLAAVTRVPPLKRLLMRHAMGMIGDLPRLVRGEAL
jgi:2-octaprenyl-6-methoxyphenol hydroxylase